MTTDLGLPTLSTGMSGIRAAWNRAGLLITPAIGPTLRLGVTPGLTTIRGASRHFTMAAGFLYGGRGDGSRRRRDCRARCTFDPSMHPRWLPGLQLAPPCPASPPPPPTSPRP